jgi:hypothetical protein
LGVSNTSPLVYLAELGDFALLPQLFSEVAIPPGAYGYQAQSERHCRRAMEEFERLKALREELTNEPITEPDLEPTETTYPVPPTNPNGQSGKPPGLSSRPAATVQGGIGFTPFSVSDHDVRGVRVALQPATAVSGEVVREGEQPAAPDLSDP